MILSASIHELGDDPITAKAEVHPETAWLELKFGFQAALNIFMPAARAKRLADAITAAEHPGNDGVVLCHPGQIATNTKVMEHVFWFEFVISTPVTASVSIEPRCDVCIVAAIGNYGHAGIDWNVDKFYLRRDRLDDVEIPFSSPLYKQALRWFEDKETGKVDQLWLDQSKPEKLGYGHLRRELL